ncbi:TPA: DegT/DnrJ/EryC1/StrS family aminotransferase [Candidatus Avigastranaerophilus faecigallinarum]|nr:DegT/DnrJ/EryC1/StrS family aminotransferase [Candidatus Avigastranaerophilus faecigallinarum]
MNKFIPVFSPDLNGNEKLYLNECIETGWLGSNGPFVKKLEKEFAKFCEQEYGSCVTNGSAALDVAIRAMKDVYKWEDFSEVIIPSFNIISAAQSCIYNKLKPVFADAETNTWNVDTSKIEELITNKTKAIVIVHIYGLPSDVDEIIKIAQKHNLKIIEDAAQAHGQEYKGRKCGSFGDVATFSFFTNKHIACGEGGIVLTSDKELIDKINYYKNLCFTKDKFIHTDLGWNCRMSNLQAAVAYAQFEKLDKTIEKKKYIGKKYHNLLKEIPAELSVEKTDYAQNHYWIFGVVINKELKLTAKEAIEKLAKENIETRPFFYPMHKQPVFNELGILDNIKRPVSEFLYDKGFYIPTGLNLTDEELEYIAEKVRNLFA